MSEVIICMFELTKYKLYNVSNSAYKLKALCFCLKWALHIVKMNYKIYVDNIRF